MGVLLQGDDDFYGPAVGITAVAGCLPSLSTSLCPADGPRVVPLERWDVDDIAALSSNALEARFGAFIENADQFDAAIFGNSR